MELTINDILKCTKGSLIIGDENKICENFSKDTRTINENDTYIGIKGENFDGSLFWEDAFEKGASTVIIQKIELEPEKIEKYKNQNKNIIQVDDTKVALEEMATFKRNMYGDNLIVVGVTGSVGKTSTKDIIANVLSKKYRTLKTEGNNNNDIGLPLTILKLKNHEAAVIEMGMNHLGEISKLTRIAKPTISVITNVGTSHIGNLGSRENILKAKLEILEGMKEKIVVINNDNDLLNKWKNENNDNVKIYTFGINNKSDCMAEEIFFNKEKSEFICNLMDNKFKLEVPIKGEHFVLNSLCASMVGNLCGLKEEEIEDGVRNFSLTKKRMEISKLEGNVTIINDSYNASFESMKASIEYLASTDSARKIAVMGDKFELGEFSEELHRKVGDEIVKNNIDVLFAIGENAKFIVDEAKVKGFDVNNIFYFETKEGLIGRLKEFFEPGDVVLFKASNGMRLFEVMEECLRLMNSEFKKSNSNKGIL